ncbi:hypothetical protein T459_04457 [Capsicum annuum]|uniref:Uncharacterized protein n=1 Tax=Capsicum annuum TaxID=4072 RepID=A0A2G3A544_CAPAN|nr:hypothetical protein T459_04457 [Capsicum annuum]
MDLSPVHHFHRANSLSHPIEERQNLLKETSMGSPTMDNTTDAKESTVKTNNIREAELSSSLFSSKTQLNTMPVMSPLFRVEDSPNHGVLTLTACLDGGLPWFHNVCYVELINPSHSSTSHHPRRGRPHKIPIPIFILPENSNPKNEKILKSVNGVTTSLISSEDTSMLNARVVPEIDVVVKKRVKLKKRVYKKTMETNMVPMVTIPYHGKPPSKQAVREVQVSFNENRAGNGSIWCRSNLSTGPGLQDEVVL